MESVDWGGGTGGWGVGRWGRGNGFDILAGRREKKEEHVGIDVMERDGMKKKKASAAQHGGPSWRDVGLHIWSRKGKDD